MNMTYKKILVAVDGSGTATLAMQEAIKLAKDQHATLRTIYVADNFVVVGDGVHFDFNQYENAVRGYGLSILDKMESLAKEAGIATESGIIENTDHAVRIPEKIVNDAKAWNADLLVIGTHGRRGISRLVLGSVAEGIIRMASTPVLLVPGKC
jgi:nucleotide-binding universal stress UspA family protein